MPMAIAVKLEYLYLEVPQDYSSTFFSFLEEQYFLNFQVCFREKLDKNTFLTIFFYFSEYQKLKLDPFVAKIDGVANITFNNIVVRGRQKFLEPLRTKKKSRSFSIEPAKKPDHEKTLERHFDEVE